MKCRDSARGGTLVEFALILPLFMLLVVTIMDFGRAYMTYQTMTNAAREGARFGAAPYAGTYTLPSISAVQAQTCGFLTAANVTCPGVASVVVDPAYIDSALPSVAGVPVTHTKVTVNYTGYSFYFLPSINMSTTAVMRNENNAT